MDYIPDVSLCMGVCKDSIKKQCDGKSKIKRKN